MNLTADQARSCMEKTTKNCLLIEFGKDWRLDGDLLRCRKCKRAIIFSRNNEAMVHKAGCSNSHLEFPWHELSNLIQ